MIIRPSASLAALNDRLEQAQEILISGETGACTCLFHLNGGKLCKHYLALRLSLGLSTPTLDKVGEVDEDEDIATPGNNHAEETDAAMPIPTSALGRSEAAHGQPPRSRTEQGRPPESC